MALTVELKPNERFILGTSVVTNRQQRTRLKIEGNAPVLREKDILTPETADTPAKRVYLAVQMMYLEGNVVKFQDEYFRLVAEFQDSVPTATAIIDCINNEILTEQLYRALKQASILIAYEEELLQYARTTQQHLHQDRPSDDQPAGSGSGPAHEGGREITKRTG